MDRPFYLVTMSAKWVKEAGPLDDFNFNAVTDGPAAEWTPVGDEVTRVGLVNAQTGRLLVQPTLGIKSLAWALSMDGVEILPGVKGDVEIWEYILRQLKGSSAGHDHVVETPTDDRLRLRFDVEVDLVESFGPDTENTLGRVFYPDEGGGPKILLKKGLNRIWLNQTIFHEVGHLVDWILSKGQQATSVDTREQIADEAEDFLNKQFEGYRTEVLEGLLAEAANNLGDLPISDAWAADWAKRAYELLTQQHDLRR